MSNLPEYPCSENSACALCPTLLNHYNLGVLCNQCRRRVTEAKYEAYDADGGKNIADVLWCDVLLKSTRSRNRRHKRIRGINAGMVEGGVSTGSVVRHHFPQDGHR